jgi:DNA modification methylase
LIFTDPPYLQYLVKYFRGLKNHKYVVPEFEFDLYNTEEYLVFLEDVLAECIRLAKLGAAVYLFVD